MVVVVVVRGGGGGGGQGRWRVLCVPLMGSQLLSAVRTPPASPVPLATYREP